jgi:opacity protein-like surface antigen
MHSSISSIPTFSLRHIAAFALSFILCNAPAHAADSVSVEAGSGNETRLSRIGVQWNWDQNWQISDNAQLSGYWDLSLAHWRGKRYRDVEGSHQNLTAIGFTPVFRLTSKDKSGPYLEIGTGPHLLSELYDNNRRQLSTRFQFGSVLGIGYVFASKLDASIRYQHYSNASIKKPNDGVNFFIVRLSYAF